MSEDEQDPVHPCCGGYAGQFGEHRYRCLNRVWPATATPEIRRTAIRGDYIGPAHAQIQDLVRGGLDYQQRKRLTEILAGIWDDGFGYGGQRPDGDYCNVCENIPCLGNHPPGEVEGEA